MSESPTGSALFSEEGYGPSAMASNNQPPHQLWQAIAELTDADTARLKWAALYHAVGTEFEPDDLIQESFRRSLNGDRNWPVGVPLLTFLSNVMKSIAWADREKAKRRPKLQPLPDELNPLRHPGEADAFDESDDTGSPLTARLHGPSAEAASIAEAEPVTNLVDEVFKLFEEDESAFTLLLGLADGMTADEIRNQQGWDKTAYGTIRRRIRRKINKAIEEDRLDGTQ